MRTRFAKIFVVLVMVSLLVTPTLYGKKASSKINLKGFPAFVEKMMKEYEVTGAAVAIVKDGKVAFARGFGYRDVEKKLQVTADTLFAIGSCSKAFTATTLGILADEGKLEWDKPVQEYLPDFKLFCPVATRLMTPMDLVTHRSGLPRHDSVWYGSSAGREEIFHRLQYLEPSKTFRSTFQYNNLMFMTAGYMAGKIAGTSWEKLVREKIFAPLGMKTSNFSVNDSQKSADFALPYSQKDKKVILIPFRNIDTIGPAGSINSSVNEMANWIILNLNKGKFGDKQVISEANLQQIHTAQMVTGAGFSRYKERFYGTYAMGWGINAYRGHPVISHGGGIDGFISQVAFLPRDNAGVVILTNYDVEGGTLAGVVANNVYDRILRMKQIPWAQRIKERREKAKKGEDEAKKKKKDDRVTGTKPSHKLAAYTGEYEHPGYGSLLITIEGDQLKGKLNNLLFNGAHYHYDIFEFTSEDPGEQKIKATFHTGVKGDIDKVSIPLQGGVKDIEFTRVPEKKMKDKAFLSQFVGEYELAGTKGLISLKGGDTLVLTVSGQPPYDLVPYKGTEFNIENLTGFSIKFLTGDDGKVTGFEAHQPNGVFTATKKK
ncbi:MAG: serine hydrolase [Candidatus Aminicenantes bacterium]|nr:serine hydrolase [Candidatus Aminicenantes bacterium]